MDSRSRVKGKIPKEEVMVHGTKSRIGGGLSKLLVKMFYRKSIFKIVILV